MIKKLNEFVNERINNVSDEQLFLNKLNVKNFEELQQCYTTKWYSLSTYGGGERKYIPSIIPMRIIASAIARYMKNKKSANTYCKLVKKFNVPRLCFYVENNNKNVEISFKDGDIIHYGEDMTEPEITVHYSGKISVIKGDDHRKFGDTDWHESEMGKISDRLLQMLNNVL